MRGLPNRRQLPLAALVVAGALSAGLSLLANVRSGATSDATLEYLVLQNKIGEAQRLYLADPTLANEAAVRMVSSGLPQVYAKIENSGEGVKALMVASLFALFGVGFAEAWKETVGTPQTILRGVFSALTFVTLVSAVALGLRGWLV